MNGTLADQSGSKDDNFVPKRWLGESRISPEEAAWRKRVRIHVKNSWVVPAGFRMQALEASVDLKLDGKVARNLDRDEMVTNTMNTFCSVTVQCARCHNHKFDPFTQEHYYSMQAIFAAVDRAERPYDADPKILRQRSELAGRPRQTA